jgi:integrase
MALFVGRGGRMMGKSRWDAIFQTAGERCRRIDGPVEMPARIRVHDARHTFAVYMLQILTQQLIEEQAEQLRSFPGGVSPGLVIKHLSRNPLLTVQRLLGHADPATTMKYVNYLEDTNVIVQRALEQWTAGDSSFAEYAATLAGRDL